MIMKKIIYGITLPLLALLLAGSCVKEKKIVSDNGEVPLSLLFPLSRGVGDNDPEFMMETLRVIIFRSNPGGVAEFGAPILNKLYFPTAPATEADIYVINEIVPVGGLNIYLIANETSNLNNPVNLNNINSSSELKDIKLNYDPGQSGGTNKLSPYILMYSEYKGADIDVNGVLRIGGVPTTILEVERTIAKITVQVECTYSQVNGYLPGTTIILTDAKIVSMPYHPYLTPNQAYGGFASGDYFESSSKSLTGWNIPTMDTGNEISFKIETEDLFFYMPEHIPGNRKYYTYLELKGVAAGMILTYKVPLGNGLGTGIYTVSYLLENYETVPTPILTVSRNTHYTLKLNIKGYGLLDALEVVVKAKDWKPTIEIIKEFE